MMAGGSLMLMAAAAAFNLSCDVKFELQVSLDEQPVKADIKTTYRVDLDSRRWCDGDCEETRPIEAITATQLILIRDADPRIDAYETLTINRESGRVYHHNRINETMLSEDGSCRRTAFTGFPEKKF